MGKGGGMSQDPDEHSSSFFSRISPGGEILDVEKAAGEVSCAFSLQRRLFRHESKLEVTLKHFGFSLFRLPLETFFFPSFFFSLLFLPSLFNFFFFLALTYIRQSLRTVFQTNCKRRKFNRLTTLERVLRYSLLLLRLIVFGR